MPTSDSRTLEQDLAEPASTYEWALAAEIYKKSLKGLASENEPARTARVAELLARAYFKAAFQAKNRAEFKKTMQ